MGKEKRILIIESEETQRRGLAVALAGEGRLIFESTNPSNGLIKASKEQVDFVLTEIRFPSEDGLKALSQLAYRIPPSRIVVITASLDDQIYRTFSDLGIQQVFEKPVNEEQIEIIQQIINQI